MIETGFGTQMCPGHIIEASSQHKILEQVSCDDTRLPPPVLLGSWLRWSPPRSFPLHTFSQKSLYLWIIVNKVTCQWSHLTCTHDRIKSLSMSALLSIYLILAATILMAWGSNKCLDERAKSVCLLEDSHTGLQPKGREVAFLSVERTDAGKGV